MIIDTFFLFMFFFLMETKQPAGHGRCDNHEPMNDCIVEKNEMKKKKKTKKNENKPKQTENQESR